MSATRPTGYPGWASGSSGAAATTEPDATTKALGFQPTGIVRAAYFNFLHNLNYQWIKYLDERAGAVFVGDGSDGDLILGATAYRALRPMSLNNLAIGPSSVFDPNGFPILVRGALTGVSGTIRSIGQTGGTGATGNASPAIGGSIGGLSATGPMRGGVGGGSPGQTGSTGEAVSNSRGGQGGPGGTGTIGLIGLGGSAIGPSGFYSVPPAINQGFLQWNTPLGFTGGYLRGGGGGGRGQNDVSDIGGGMGGGGGSVIVIACQEVNFVGVIDVQGGPGGYGFGRGAGGGGGGGGGISIAYGRKTALQVAAYYNGGAGGLGATSSYPVGITGSTGTYLETQL